MVEAVDRALADAGSPRFFHGIVTDGQDAALLFAEPAAAGRAAAAGLFELDPEASSREAGMAFEEHVRRSLGE